MDDDDEFDDPFMTAPSMSKIFSIGENSLFLGDLDGFYEVSSLKANNIRAIVSVFEEELICPNKE